MLKYSPKSSFRKQKHGRYSVLLFLFVLIIASYIQCKPKVSNDAKPILVTAPSVYNTRLCAELNKMHLTTLSFPVIETELLTDDKIMDDALQNLASYDYIALPSRNAIKSYFKNAHKLNIPLHVLQEKQYCAIGKDQEYLRSFGISSIIKNQEPSPQGIVNALRQKHCGGQSIAVFAPLVMGIKEPNVIPDFIDSLKQAGMEVEHINAYTTSIYHPEKCDSVLSLIEENNIGLIAFTSTGEIDALLSLLGERSKLKNTPISCFGPYTYNNAIKRGLKPTFMAKDFSSFENYAISINKYFN